jgi:hypothetical protein
VLCFYSLVLAGPWKCSLVWYTLKHGVAHNPMLHSGHLNFVLVDLFLSKHAQQPVSKNSICCIMCQVCLVCLSCLVVCIWGTLPVSCIMSLTNVSLNSCCHDFEPHKVRMIAMSRMVNSIRGKNSFFVHFAGHLIIILGSPCCEICPLTPYVYYSLIPWLGSEIFYAHPRNYPLLVEKACLAIHLHYVHHSTPWLSNYSSS